MAITNRRQTLRSLMGVIAAMAVVNLIYGITFPLLALVLDGQGVSKTLIGLSTLSQAAAALAISPLVPRLLRHFAPARLMQTASVVLAGLFILAGLVPNVWVWFPVRFAIGALNTMMWISSEALINELAHEGWRGRIIGIYTSVGAAGFALGPFLLIFTGSEGMLPFYSTSALVLCAAVPLFFARDCRLKPNTEEKITGVWAVLLLAPTIMLANSVYASAAESIITFFPLFGFTLGLSENFSLWLLTLMGLGSMVLILPLSWVADHVNRMAMLSGCIVLTLIGLFIMPWVLQHALAAQVYVFVFGGVEGMIYALGVMLIGQRFRGSMLAAASAAFTAAWALGTMIGPSIVGAGMDYFGPERMPYLIALFFALYLPLPVLAWLRPAKRNLTPG